MHIIFKINYVAIKLFKVFVSLDTQQKTKSITLQNRKIISVNFI